MDRPEFLDYARLGIALVILLGGTAQKNRLNEGASRRVSGDGKDQPVGGRRPSGGHALN